MDTPLQTHDRNFIDNRRLIAGLKHALDLNYARVLDSARQQWERNFAGKDPSDACVSVRITSGEGQKSSLACAGKKVHALRITGPGGVSAVTARLKPGQSTTVDVIARKKGTYTYFDPVAGHRKKGMVGLALLG